MNREEVGQLLIQIKVFYSRFESVEKEGGTFRVSPATIDSWYTRLGYMNYTKAIQILDRYMESDQGNRVPNINLWLNGGKVQQEAVKCTATLERRRGVIRWEPESGKVFEIPVTYNQQYDCWEDEDGRLWAMAGEEGK